MEPMECGYKDCHYSTPVINAILDDGTSRFCLCPNDQIRWMLEGMTLENITSEKSHLPHPAHCELCADEGYVMEQSEVTLQLCKTHIRDILNRNLSPEAFHQLKDKHGIFHLIHDDFYDPFTGEAFQPVMDESE